MYNSFSDAIKVIRRDYIRYSNLCQSGSRLLRLKTLIKLLLFSQGLKFTIWMRLTNVNSVFHPICWLFYLYYSKRYCIQIPYKTEIGPGLYLGHGMCIVINLTAKIGENASISQFCNIGSNNGKSAVVGKNVYLGPHVCLVENVIIGDNCVIGAGAVVTHDIPANSIAAGVPARVIRENNYENH